jgi:hypothetical protein
VVKPQVSRHADVFATFWQFRRCMAAPAGFELAVRPPRIAEFDVKPVIPAWMRAAHAPFGAPAAVRSNGAALHCEVVRVPQYHLPREPVPSRQLLDSMQDTTP